MKKIRKSIAVFLLSLALILLLPSAAFAADTWTNISLQGGSHLRSIAKNEEGLYVVVGNNGTLKTTSSIDMDQANITWKRLTTGIDDVLWGCAYGKGVFVAVGGAGVILRSEDGRKWSNIPFGAANLYDITYGANGFVAVGTTGSEGYGQKDSRVFYSSVDGITWVEVFKDTGAYWWSHVKYLNGKYITLGFTGGIMYSDDAKKWEYKDPVGGSINDIAWDGSQYIAISTFYNSDNRIHKILKSDNLLNWSEIPTPNNINFLNRIFCFDDRVFIIDEASPADRILYSTNLNTWIDTSIEMPAVTEVFSERDKAIIIGFNDSMTVLKKGGDYKRFLGDKVQNFIGAVYNGSQVLFATSEGEILTLQDGGLQENHTENNFKDRLVGIVWTGDKYYGLCSKWGNNSEIVNSSIYTSADGVSWSMLKDLGIPDIDSIHTANGKIFLLGREGQILSSADGLNWETANTNHLNNATVGNWLRSITYNGSVYVCVGMFGNIFTSSDGINWRHTQLEIKTDLNDVIWTDNRFVAVGGAGTVCTSYDGVDWKQYFKYENINLENVVWTGKQILASSTIGDAYEIDESGQISRLSKVGSSSTDIIWTGEKVIFVGLGGIVAYFEPSELVKVKVNGSPIVFDVAPTIINGRTLIPVRAVFEKMGATVMWDGNTRTVTVIKNDINVKIEIESTTAYINGDAILLDVPATVKNGRTLVPVRFIAEALKAKVDWVDTTRTVEIVL